MIPSEAAQRSNVPQLQSGWWTATTSCCIRTNYSTDYRQLLLAFFFLFLFFPFFPELRGYFILFDIFWTDVLLQMSGPWQLPANISLQWFTAHVPYKDKHTHKSAKNWNGKGCYKGEKKVWKAERTKAVLTACLTVTNWNSC